MRSPAVEDHSPGIEPPIHFSGELPHLHLRRRTLPCGLDVVLHHDPEVPQIAVNVWYRVGSSDERPDRTGFAHLFEHLFKGPPAWLGGHHYEVLKRAGATDANASTSSDRTAYHEVVPGHELDLALWIESGRMGYFADGFDEQRLVTQQSVVRAERRQRYEDVAYGAERFATGRALYPEGHPHRHLTIGLHEHIQAATVDDVLAFYRTWYVPANATLVLAGDLPDDIDDRIDRFFGAFPPSLTPGRRIPITVTPTPVREHVTDRFAALGRIHRAWHGPPAQGTGEAELDVLAAAWAAPGTGALWRRLVYETPLAQRVSVWTVNHRLGGEFHIAVDLRTGADPERVRAILDEECATGVDERDIERIVIRREANAIWGLTSLSRRAQLLQRHALYTGDPDGIAADLARYRAVTPAGITAAIRRWLAPELAVEIVTDPALAAADA